MKTVKFYTLGCKVNQYETQVIREHFVSKGFKEIDDEKEEKADIYVINTCTVTQTADRKSRYFIHYAYRQNPQARIVVTGCYAQLDSDSAEIAKMPGVIHIIKNEEKDRIMELFHGQNGHNELNEHTGIGIPNAVNQGSHASGSRAEVSASRSYASERRYIRERDTEAVTPFGISSFFKHTRAFLKIQDGCDNFCSYCKVPLVRGVLKSKTLADIIQEAERLVKNGFKEIVLCGICLGSYGRDLNHKISLVEVARQLENIRGLLRLRFSSIEPAYVSEELIDAIAHSQKLCRHLHIPLQSGDDEILRKMNRKYCRHDYLKLIHKIKSRIPEIAITTDVLAGFPGEKEINFRNTVDLIKEISPLKVHIFPYSPRKGTSAFSFQDRVKHEIVKERILRLKDIAEICAFNYKKQFLNQDMEVFMECQSAENPQVWQGLTDNYIKVLIKSFQNLKNQIITLRLVRIIKDVVLAELPL